VRAATPAWLAAGAWVIHQTGASDPEADTFQHPHYIHRPFFDQMAGLFARANLVISRAGAGTLTELAFTHAPSILIPYPFAAEDHQAYNAAAFAAANAAVVSRQSDLTVEHLQDKVLALINDPERLNEMAEAAASLAIPDSAAQLAELVQTTLATDTA
jgi:UDP-N-acetylglucosamine--N-acetylmuramyl-(pentapeptide) pyrophosphoryl-undecaprenol N-acetylglucosamine transferase